MTSFEETLRDAFQLAENSRRAAGLERRHVSEMRTTRKDGTVWTGPSAYKVTLYFRPWHYADLMHAKLSTDRPDQSLNRFVQTIVDKHVANVAARPEPKAKEGKREKGGKIVPMRRKHDNATAIMNAKAAAQAATIARREATG